MQQLPIVFQRSKKQKSTGCTLYFLYMAIGSIVFMIIGLIAHDVLVKQLQIDKEIAKWCLLGLFCIACSFLAIWLFSSYRKRAFAELRIEEKHWQWVQGNRKQSFSYEDINTLQMLYNLEERPESLVIGLASGKKLVICYIEKLQEAWENFIAITQSILLQRFHERLKKKESVIFLEPLDSKRWKAIGGGFLCLIGVLWSIVLVNQIIEGSGSASSIFTIVACTFTGILLISNYSRAKSAGLVVLSDGIRQVGEDSQKLSWEQIQSVRETVSGIILESTQTKNYYMTPGAENFAIFTSLIKAYLSPKVFQEKSIGHIDLIPHKLRILIYHHKIETEQKFFAYSYVSKGLWQLGQKEIIFTIRCELEDNHQEIPQDFFKLWETIYQNAQQGDFVDVDNFTIFKDPGAIGRSDFQGVVYVSPSSLQYSNIALPSLRPLLAAIFVTQEEIETIPSCGIHRLLNRLGRFYRIYPYPTWTDRKRPAMKSDTGASILEKSPCKVFHEYVQVLYQKQQQTIAIQLPNSSKESWKKIIEEIPPEGFALIANTSSQADSALVWEPGQTEMQAICGPDQKSNLTAGCFIGFCPGIDNDAGNFMEDGFILSLTNESWEQLKNAWAQGENITIAATTDKELGHMDFRLEWLSDVYHNPIDGKDYLFSGGYSKFPTTAKLSEDSEIGVWLLTNENVVFMNIGAYHLGELCQKIIQIVEKCCANADILPKGLIVQCDLTSPKQALFRMFSKLPLEEKISQTLEKHLKEIDIPSVREDLVFQIAF